MVEPSGIGARKSAERPRTPWRGHLYLVLQALRNRPLGSYMQTLEERERLSPEAFEQLHRDELCEILRYARAHVPLYGSGPWKAALSTADAGDIRSWPLLRKEIVRERVDQLAAMPASGSLIERRTSGSTGQRIRIYLTREADAWGWAHRYRGLLWHGIPIGVPSLRLTHAHRPLRDLVKGERSLTSLDSPASIEQALRYLESGDIELVTGPPSVLFHLARHLRELGVSAPLAPFARSGGEPCFDFQRREIQARLGARVIDSYGCNEIGPLAGECPAGLLHVYADHVHVEIFDGEKPAPPGESGEIVVTSLRNRAMPLVRYPVGDRGRLTGEHCSCGLPQPVLSDLRARSHHMVRRADGTLFHASELISAIGSIFDDPISDGIRQFQVTAAGDQGWEVSLEAAARPANANGGESRRTLEDRIGAIVRQLCGDDTEVRLQFTTAVRRVDGKLNYLHKAG